jgi:hypothetical protein
MATTTNYGWTTPDDTALVKDGAAAIRTLGSSVDTTTKNLNPSTTLGDIEYRSSTANTNTRLGIGTTGQVLTVAGGVPSWATAAGGGSLTSLASGSLSGASVNLTSISQSYTHLQLILRDFYPASSGQSVRLKLNADSTASNYVQFKGRSSTSTPFVGSDASWYFDDNGSGSGNTSTGTHAIVNIFDYANTTTATIIGATFYYRTSAAADLIVCIDGLWKTVDNIDQINLDTSSGNFGGGSYILYGVK